MHKSLFKPKMLGRAIVLFSGGQDSTYCLFRAKRDGYEPVALSVNYGQRHKQELASAGHIAALLDIRHDTVTLPPGTLRSTSPLVSGSQLEQYADHCSLPGGIEKTFVPMRNLLFLTLAANRAMHLEATAIYTGVCQEDYGGYPDCRQTFIDAFVSCAKAAGFPQRPIVATPLMDLSKAEMILDAYAMDQCCYEMWALSHTAYDGIYPPKGKDHATLLRSRGFAQADLPDPLVIRAFSAGLMPLPKTPNYAQDRPRIAAAFERVQDFLNLMGL